MNNIITVNQLTKKFGAVTALDNFSVKIPKGIIVGLLGPNGSGKTTLIKILNGLLTADSGEALINNTVPSPETKAAISYLPDRNYFDDWMTVVDILSLFETFYKDFDRDKAEYLLEDLHIDAKQRFKHLSKGNKEKVQLVMVMSRKAQLYLLDEPIGGVDPATRDYILNTIIRNYHPEATVVISTHLIADVENVLDEVIFIRGGQMVLQSPVDQIREEKGLSVDALFREVFKC